MFGLNNKIKMKLLRNVSDYSVLDEIREKEIRKYFEIESIKNEIIGRKNNEINIFFEWKKADSHRQY